MQVRQVDAKQGWQWIMTGFFLFRRAPLVWIILCATLLLIAATLALIPIAGQFIFTLLSPVFLAGVMIGCKTLERGRPTGDYPLAGRLSRHCISVDYDRGNLSGRASADCWGVHAGRRRRTDGFVAGGEKGR